MSAGSLVLGIVNGLTIGLLGIGLVLVYRSNRFLNLAHGQMGALASVVLAKLVIDDGWNWWEALVVCVPVGIMTALLIERFLIRPLRERSATAASLLLVTIGATQILIGITLLQLLNASPDRLVAEGYPTPFHAAVRIAGVVLNGSDVLTVIAVPILVGGLAAFLQLTTMGKSIRAAASNPDAARLCGISTRRVSSVTWAIAGALAALTAILQGPSQSAIVASSLGPDLLFLALGSAATGAFTSLPLAMVGGLGIGIAQQLTLAASHDSTEAELVVFLLVVAIVLVRGRAIGAVFATSGAAVEERAPVLVNAAAEKVLWIRHRQPLLVLGASAVMLLLPLVPGLTSESHRFQLAEITALVLVAMSLTVAIGWAGQVTLGQFAVLGGGAFIAARLLEHGWSLPFVVIPAGLVGAAVMVVVGLPALRVPGLTLAVTTLGFAIVGQDWLFRQSWFGSNQNFGVLLNPPSLARGLGRPSGQIVVYYFGCLLLLVFGLGAKALRRTQAGRLIVAVRDNGPAASAMGVTPATVKLGAMALSGFLAAVGGVVWADAWRNVSMSQFPPELSFTLLALPVLGGVGSIGGGAVAAALFFGATFFMAPHFSGLFGQVGSSAGFQVFLGGLGLTMAVRFSRGGLAGAIQGWLQKRITRLPDQPLVVSERPVKPTLRVQGVHLHFGGIKALNGASIEVRPGEIVGLIGPNGAGKTSLINVISGYLSPDQGSVGLDDLELVDLPTELRAAFGLSRSFQDARLFPGLTVAETIQVAVANRQRASILASAAMAPWVVAAEAETRQTADEIIARFGLSPWARQPIAELSTGTRRICDLAVQVATNPSVLLLDEPTAGVAQREAEAFGPLLRQIREELDCSILIVEHDMPLLMGLCDRIYALASGAVIASGTPSEIRSDPEVIASYLGTNEAAVQRSRTRPTSRETGSAEPGAANGRRVPAKASSRRTAATPAKNRSAAPVGSASPTRNRGSS